MTMPWMALRQGPSAKRGASAPSRRDRSVSVSSPYVPLASASASHSGRSRQRATHLPSHVRNNEIFDGIACLSFACNGKDELGRLGHWRLAKGERRTVMEARPSTCNERLELRGEIGEDGAGLAEDGRLSRPQRLATAPCRL